jgi:hypothetical protein
MSRGIARADNLATREQLAAFQDRFLRLLERRTALYTMGDSSSVPKHTAIELMRAVCFVLGFDPEDGEVPDRLLSADLEAEFARGLSDLERKMKATDELWREVCLVTPPIYNIALRDTIATLGGFTSSYDYRFMAHDCACSFDYQLCHPVPEDLLGIDYIYEYLRRLYIEGDLLGRFELDTCVRLIDASCPDYQELLINLYEPVAANAMGRVLAGEDPRALEVGQRERTAIAQRLTGLGRAARERVLREAASATCHALGISDTAARDYLAEYAIDLRPRIEVGLAQGNLTGVFVPF